MRTATLKVLIKSTLENITGILLYFIFNKCSILNVCSKPGLRGINCHHQKPGGERGVLTGQQPLPPSSASSAVVKAISSVLLGWRETKCPAKKAFVGKKWRETGLIQINFSSSDYRTGVLV